MPIRQPDTPNRDEQLDHQFTLRLHQVSELERILGICRTAGATVLDCSIDKADLEDVFVDMMKGKEVTR